MPEAVVHEGELSGDVSYQFENHSTARRHIERLNAVRGVLWRSAEVDCFELFSNHVEGTRIRWSCDNHVESDADPSLDRTGASWYCDGRPLKATMSGTSDSILL